MSDTPTCRVRADHVLRLAARLTADQLDDVELIANLKSPKELRLLAAGARAAGHRPAAEQFCLCLLVRLLKDVRRANVRRRPPAATTALTGAGTRPPPGLRQTAASDNPLREDPC